MTTTTNTDALELLRTSARMFWHAADQAHVLLRGAALGRAFGMSERWGSEQAARAKAERDAWLREDGTGQMPEHLRTPSFLSLVARIQQDRTLEEVLDLLKWNQLPGIVGPSDLRLVGVAGGPGSAQDEDSVPTGTPESESGEAPQIGTQGPDGSARTGVHAVPMGQGVDPSAAPTVPQQRANGDLGSGLLVASTSRDQLSEPVPTSAAWMENYAPMPDTVPIGTPESARAQAVPTGTHPDWIDRYAPLPVGTQDPVPTGTPESAGESASGERTQTAAQIKPLTGWARFWYFLICVPVIAPGLAYSAWSIYGYARTGSAPIWLALLGSPALDGAALFCAAFATMFQNLGQPTKLPRLGTYGSIVAGILVNYSRAGELHHSGVGMYVLLIGPAVIASLVFEIVMTRIRHQERARREARRTTRQSAKVDLDLWLRHPLLIHRVRQYEARERIKEAFPGAPVPEPSPALGRVLMVLGTAATVGILTLWMTGKI